MSLAWDAIKDPDEVKDYSIDWNALLAGDTISTVTWTVPDGLTGTTQLQSGAVTTLFIGGGQSGDYTVGCRISTTGGRTYDRSVRLRVRSR